MDAVADEIKGIMVFAEMDNLASVELKGALLLPSTACRLSLPCVVVRKRRRSMV